MFCFVNPSSSFLRVAKTYPKCIRLKLRHLPYFYLYLYYIHFYMLYHMHISIYRCNGCSQSFWRRTARTSITLSIFIAYANSAPLLYRRSFRCVPRCATAATGYNGIYLGPVLQLTAIAAESRPHIVGLSHFVCLGYNEPYPELNHFHD